MVPDADIRLPRMAVRLDCRRRSLFCLDAICGARRELDAASGVVLRSGPAFQRHGTHHWNDSWPHGRIGHVFASGAGILFLALSIYRIHLVDDSALPDREGKVLGVRS